jgi:hypothetical protein
MTQSKDGIEGWLRWHREELNGVGKTFYYNFIEYLLANKF